jgi:hypothetical protein
MAACVQRKLRSAPRGRRPWHVATLCRSSRPGYRCGHVELRFRRLRVDERAGERLATAGGERARLGQSGRGNRELGHERPAPDQVSPGDPSPSNTSRNGSAAVGAAQFSRRVTASRICLKRVRRCARFLPNICRKPTGGRAKKHSQRPAFTAFPRPAHGRSNRSWTAIFCLERSLQSNVRGHATRLADARSHGRVPSGVSSSALLGW